MMTARKRGGPRKSRLCASRAEIAALIGSVVGRDAASAIRYGARFDPTPRGRSSEIDDRAWHPATQLTAPRRGRSGGDDRGSAEDRRRRKRFLLDTWGDGATAPCAFCRCELTYDTVTVDRFPIPGRLGGRYTRDNIRPACAQCNKEDQGRAGMLAASMPVGATP